MSDAKEIRAQIDCRYLARYLGVGLARSQGAQWRFHCFNSGHHKNADRNPSLSIGPGGFRCYASGCGIKGDCFELVKLIRSCGFKESLDWLESYLGKSEHVPREAPRQTDERTARQEQPGFLRVEVMNKIWDFVQPLSLTSNAERWLKSRGMDPAIAHDLGCRDWHEALGRIRFFLGGLDSETKLAAGFYGAEDKPWWPLAEAMKGEPWASGLCVPVFDGKHLAPLSWRWRLYKKRKSGSPKTLAQPGQAIAPLLGLRAWGQLRAVGECPDVIVCEGEPDWLSIHDVVRGRAAVLGLVAIQAGWRDEWTRHLEGARTVICMVHEDQGGGQRLFEGLHQALADRLGSQWADRACRKNLLDGEDDANDLHIRGELAAVLDELLDE